MGILRSSRRIGRPLKELSAAWEVRYSGQSAGPDHSTRMHFIAPRLCDAAPKLFDQGLLWEDLIKPEDTAFDLMGDMVWDVANQSKESERFDSDLLRRVARFETAFKRGVSSVTLHGDRLDSKPPIIDHKVTSSARLLYEETPRPRRVRVAGTLDMIRVSDRVFELLLKGGQRLRAVWSEETVVSLKDFLNQQVVIEGQAIYRPSRSLLRIDTSAISCAKEADLFFSEIPEAVAQRLDPKSLRKSQGSTTGINAVWGKWPGSETEAELLAALKDLG